MRRPESTHGHMARVVHLPELPQRILLRVSLGPPREKNVDRVSFLADKIGPGLCSRQTVGCGGIQRRDRTDTASPDAARRQGVDSRTPGVLFRSPPGRNCPPTARSAGLVVSKPAVY